MTEQHLAGKSVAILVANGFEETEMTEPQRALLRAGASVKVISPEQGLVNGWMGAAWGHYFPVDLAISEVLGADFDMLVLPGGLRSITKLKQNPHTRRIVGHFLDAGKPVAVCSDGVDLLALTEKIEGCILTGAPTAQANVEAAGATWSPEPMVVDHTIVSAQGLDVLPAFVEQILKLFADASLVREAA